MYNDDALKLYLTAFPEDEPAFAEDFLNRFFESSCRYIIKDGKLVSMLFLLDAVFTEKGREQRGKYLYAAATLPEYRGQGLMAQLIEKAKKETAEKGMFLITKPATKSLFDYYRRFGFKTAVYSKDCMVELGDIAQPLKKLDREEYIRKRNELLKNEAHITLLDTKYAYSFFELFGGEKTVAAVDLSEDIPLVKEFISFEDDGKDRLLSTLKKQKALFRLKGEDPFAMIINTRETGREEINFNIALD